MTDKTQKLAAKPASTTRTPKKLVPRTAPKPAAKAAAAEATTKSATRNPAPAATPAAPDQAKTSAASAPKKPRAPRQPSEVEQTVAKHQKVLADALAKAQAIKYDQPKVMKQEAPKAAKAAKPAKPEKPAKAKKIKLVRDSYAMPETEYARIGELKKRLAALGSEVKKSELLRGGIALLAALNDSELKAVMGRVERIKTGRPNK